MTISNNNWKESEKAKKVPLNFGSKSQIKRKSLFSLFILSKLEKKNWTFIFIKWLILSKLLRRPNVLAVFGVV